MGTNKNQQNLLVCWSNLLAGASPDNDCSLPKRKKQMAKELRYSLTTSADRRTTTPTLYVCVAYKGSSTGRKYFIVQGLISPDFTHWNKAKQRFNSGTYTATDNNPKLEELCELCDKLLENSAITSPKKFVEALERNEAPPAETLGDFLRELIDDWKSGKNNKLPSKAYQPYINLLHKLETEKDAEYKEKVCDLINVPIDKVDNKCFIQFHYFVLSLSDKEGRSNYLNIMKLFKQVHKKAFELEKNDTVLRFPYSKHAPYKKKKKEKRSALTTEQYAKFVELDVKTLPKSGTLTYELMQLYKDYCIFLYEMFSRPVDVTRAHSNDIVTINRKKFLSYIPTKKKNNTQDEDGKTVCAPITDTAMKIINKYKGKSSQGYIFPFSMNEYEWDMTNAEDWNKWNNRKQRVQEMINSWLRNKVAQVIGVDFPLTLYIFRHSTFTHACMAKGMDRDSIIDIAKKGGSSLKMIDKHYYSNTVAI